MRDEATASAPGRVNLIGEHTDYHDGYVLPTIIPQRTHVRLRRRADRAVRASSTAVAGGPAIYELGCEAAGADWIDYVQGVTAILARKGVELGGFEVHIESTIPAGAGVSSSAALEVALLRGLRELFRLHFDDVQLARMAQAVETTFVGAPVGIMDQMACSLGREREALFLDTRTLAFERVPLPASVELIVIDSGVPHAHASGEYSTRRGESFAAAARLGVEHLRDIGVAALPAIEALPPLLARRARHVVTENQRVLEAVDAIKNGDVERLGLLFHASHASMRDDFQTSTSEVDTLVRIGEAHPDVFGARLTGGGFGGAVVMLARAGNARAAAASIRDTYARATGRMPVVLMPYDANTSETR